MAVVNKICKGTDGIKSCSDLKKALLRKLEGKLKNYDQGRIIFDEYREGSLKEKIRTKRLGGVTLIEFTVTDETEL